MKAKITPKHAGSPDPGPWPAQPHHENGDPGPGRVTQAAPQAGLPRPYVGLTGGTATAGDRPAGRWPAHMVIPDPALSSPVTCRAVIGDELRRPALWCQMGACVARHADPEAIGEADNRARAVAAGWREDALGRFACPSCLQRSTEFRVRYPVVPWDKEQAMAMAFLMTVAARQRDASGPAAPAG